jgi:polar amino acid transport system substrate-binding protein
MRPPFRHLAGLALLIVTLAGCGATSDHAQELTLSALRTPIAKGTSSQDEPTVSCNPKTKTASLRPPATLPAPGKMPAGSFMAKIQAQGHLVAGVNAGAYRFGSLNPTTGNIEGFEVDLVKQLAKAIFGSANGHVRLVALTVGQRLPAVEQGRVDIVADTMTITCYRRTVVDFSNVYYENTQKLLVPKKSGIGGIGALAHKKVCATKNSTPYDEMRKKPAAIRPVVIGKTQAIDCLVALQQGDIEGISTDSAILLGFKAQDPNTEIVGSSLGPVPYGMAINKNRRDFVRFVNGVLAELERNGTWQRLQNHWLGQWGLEPPPKAKYDG